MSENGAVRGNKWGAIGSIVFGALSFVFYGNSLIAMVLGLIGVVLCFLNVKAFKVVALVGGVISFLGILLAVVTGNW